MQPQNWQRDGEGPCIALGEAGAFDDMHVHAPCVAYENGVYRMWYCGARGEVKNRVFRMGLATSRDGIHFDRHPASPVFEFGEGTRSILTPTLLHDGHGGTIREGGRLRLWFSSADFPAGAQRHTLHVTTSEDGLSWASPSDPQLENAYSPTVIKDGNLYKLWYSDVSTDPWCLRYAHSRDGCRWKVHPEPVIVLDQPYEYSRLFYPCVRKDGDLYLMWYGAYQPPNTKRTALNFATSRDGIAWEKNPHNPVFGPDPSREWESNFTTSQSLMEFADGSWRVWYASRTKSPFVHKYYAIGTAHLSA